MVVTWCLGYSFSSYTQVEGPKGNRLGWKALNHGRQQPWGHDQPQGHHWPQGHGWLGDAVGDMIGLGDVAGLGM